jgi:hypothetical protein
MTGGVYVIEIIVKEHLSASLPVGVYMEIPPELPDRFVVLKKADSSREDQLDAAMFVADSYAPSLYEAALLNEQVKTAMDTLIEHPAISHVQRSGDYPLTNTAIKRHRYQAVFDVSHY